MAPADDTEPTDLRATIAALTADRDLWKRTADRNYDLLAVEQEKRWALEKELAALYCES